MTQWIADYYGVVDQMDIDKLAAVTSPQVAVSFGNAPRTEGFDALAAGLTPLWGSLDDMKHNVVRLWEIPGSDYGAIEAQIDYTRKDGKAVRIPCTSTLHRDTDGRVDELNVYIDLAPLFA